MGIEINKMTVKDIYKTEELLKTIINHKNYHDNVENYNSLSTREEIKDYILEDDSEGFIAEIGEKIVGVLLCYSYSPFGSSKILSRDQFIQMDMKLSEYKQSKIFSLLFKEFEKWAKSKNSEWIFFGENKRNYLKKFLTRNNYEIEDIVWKKHLN